MLKLFVAVVVLGGVGLVIAYYWGGTRTFDPTAQGQQAKAALAPGMTWQQVVDAAGKPLRFQTIHEMTKRGVTTYERGAPRKFEREGLEGELANNAHPHGFVFSYEFSPQSSFAVEFDNAGVAQSIEDLMTIADLLDTRKK
jgi:hypothetical protein